MRVQKIREMDTKVSACKKSVSLLPIKTVLMNTVKKSRLNEPTLLNSFSSISFSEPGVEKRREGEKGRRGGWRRRKGALEGGGGDHIKNLTVSQVYRL